MRRRVFFVAACLGASLGLLALALKTDAFKREPASVAAESKPEADLITAAIGEALGYTPAALRLRRSCLGFAWGASEAELIVAGAGHLEHDGVAYFGKASHAFADREFRVELFAEQGLARMRATLKDVGDDDFGALHQRLVEDYGPPAIDVPLAEGDWTGRATSWSFGTVGVSLQVATRKANGNAAVPAPHTVLTLSCEKREPPVAQ